MNDEACETARADPAWPDLPRDKPETRHRAAIRDRIEQAALPLFVASGIGAVPVDEIARKAEISRRTFYRYFASPEDIVVQALCRVMDDWADAVRHRPTDEPLIDAFAKANATLSVATATRETAGLVVRLLARPEDAWPSIAGRVHAHVASGMREIAAIRLAHAGADRARAGAVAAALTAVIMHLVEEATRKGRAILPGEIEAGLGALALILAPGA